MAIGWTRRVHGGSAAYENRHHVLSDLRRLRRRRDGARHRTRAAWTRDPFHHVPAAVPPAVVPATHLLPRSRCRPLSTLRVSTLRPRARRTHARGGAAP